jgi:hypothetical protein
LFSNSDLYAIFYSIGPLQTGLIRQPEREQVTGILTKSPSSVGNTRYSTKSEGSVPPGKYNYREALSIQNANGFAKKTLGIKFADYSGIDIETANNWNEWLSESMNRMPELKKTITGTGTSQARYRAEYKIFVEKLRKRNLPLEEAERLAKKMALKTPPKCHAYSITNASSGINGIFINKNFDAANIAADVRSGFHPVGTGTLKGIFDHEIAHHIDELLGLSKSPEINKLFASLEHFEIEVGLSRYAAKKGIEEFIAEAWSEYLNNPNPRLLARQVGDIINQKYVLLAGTK